MVVSDLKVECQKCFSRHSGALPMSCSRIASAYTGDQQVRVTPAAAAAPTRMKGKKHISKQLPLKR